MVKKKDDGWSPFREYRLINAQIVPDRYSISPIQDFSQQLSSCNIICWINLLQAFHQINVAKEDIPKTAVTPPLGLYKYLVMPTNHSCISYTK